MASRDEQYDDNVSGPFYVDTDCIACDTCVNIARSHFKLTLGNDHAIVYKQPETDAEVDSCFEALEACPVDAIGHGDT